MSSEGYSTDWGFITYNEAHMPNISESVQVTMFLGRTWKELKDIDFSASPLTKVSILSLYYLVGMATFSLSAPFRLIRVVVRLAAVVIAIFVEIAKKIDSDPDDKSWWYSNFNLKDRAQCLGVSSLKLLAIPISILCPPLGYLIEDKLNALLPDSDGIFYAFAILNEGMTLEDALTILNLDQNASEKDIKSKYKELALKYHPDKNGGKDAQFKELVAAYQFLETRNFKINPIELSDDFKPQPLLNKVMNQVGLHKTKML